VFGSVLFSTTRDFIYIVLCGIMMKNNNRNVIIDKKVNHETCLDYGRIKWPSEFRYHILKNIIQSIDADVIMMIDSNQSISGKQMAMDEEWLNQQKLLYAIMPAHKEPQIFFGVKLGIKSGQKKKQTEKRIIIDIDAGAFTEEFFKTIEDNDISIGFGSRKTFAELCEAYRVGGEKILFDETYFENSLYDSILCARLRSTLDLERQLEAVKNEMGL